MPDIELYDVDAPRPSSTEVHPTAIVEPGAELGVGVQIGPYCVVGPKAVLLDGVHLQSHVTVSGRTTIGARSAVHSFATVGVPPQDLKYAGEDGELIIGEENSIRQYANLSIGTPGGGGRTVIGRRNLLMAYVHIAHDCVLGDNNIIANGVSLAGHVEVASRAVIGGHAAVHQFCRVGTMSMTAGGAMVVQDVPPFCMVHGDRATPSGLNVVGLKRGGFSPEEVKAMKDMYRLLYKEQLTVDDCIERIGSEVPDLPIRNDFVDFLKKSERGVCR